MTPAAPGPTTILAMLGTDVRLIGMVHVGALPGTPRSSETLDAITERAVREARMLAEGGMHAVLIENMHDVPYLRREVGPEIVAAMTRIALAVEAAITVPLGVQILAGANRAALAVAQAAGATFIRAEGFAYAAVADEGIFGEADAGLLLRERRRLGAGGVGILADVRKKHSAHAITADLSLGEIAQGAEFMGADGVIVTGGATGEPTSASDVKAVRSAVSVPVLVGSGVTPDSAPVLLDHADALIVGSALKHDGLWSNQVDPARVAALVESIR